jgi:hypothetical protein
MIDVGYKFKSSNGINVTVIKIYNTWGSFIVEMRKIDERGKVEREGVKLVTLEEIKNKTVNFEEDYIKFYTNMMRQEVRRKR